MTPVARFLKRWCERLFGTWEEGYAPPDRYREMAIMFANDHPNATRRQWLDFAEHLANEAHKAGFTRGWEMDLRTAEKPWHGEPPEDAAAMLDPGWHWSPAVLLEPDDTPR